MQQEFPVATDAALLVDGHVSMQWLQLRRAPA